jgi:hypothetical protein
MTGRNFTLRIQNWTGDTPITNADYNQYDGVNYDDGNFNNTDWISASFNNITISNFTCIAKEGYTKLVWRQGFDVLQSPTAVGTYENIYGKSYDHADADYPRLYVWFTVPNKLRVTFFNNTGGVFMVNDTIRANGSMIELDNLGQEHHLELVGITLNNSYFWEWFSWNGTFANQTGINFYDWTYQEAGDHNVTIWCLFNDEMIPSWLIELNTLPNWEILILTITSLFFTMLFLYYKIPLWGIISFGSWLIEGLVWIFINPVSYFVSLLFFGIATVILILTLILQLEAAKLRKRGLGEERMAPV